MQELCHGRANSLDSLNFRGLVAIRFRLGGDGVVSSMDWLSYCCPFLPRRGPSREAWVR